MKHSTFRKSSLISSIALLLVAIVALSGATFAWFSTNATADATGINATTSQGSNLILSEYAVGPWFNSLDLSANTDNLVPVTTDDLTEWWTAKADTWDAQVPNSDGYSEVDSTSADGKYIKDTIYVKHAAGEGAAAHDLKVTLDVQAAENSYATYDYYRVAIAPVAGTVENGLSNTTVTEPIFYSINPLNHHEDAEHGTYTATQNKEIALGSIEANEVYAFDIYIWFEGEDVDCIDTYSANDITLDLDFS